MVGNIKIAGISLCLDKKNEILDFMKELIRINALGNSKRMHKVGKIAHIANDEDSKLLPLADSKQKIFLIYH